MRLWLFPLWVIVDVLIFLAAVALWIAAPEYRSLNMGVTVFALSLGILLCFFRRAQLSVYLRSDYFKKSFNHTLNIILVLSIVGIINYLGNKNYQEFDLTIDKKNSLTDQTQKVLEMIKAPLEMTVYAKREEWKPILDLVKLFEAQDSGIRVKAIDTDLRPELVKENNISKNGTVILKYLGKESRFMVTDELSITNALLKILKDEKIILYLTTGHQELTCQNKAEEGISELCEKLENQNYEVREINLAQTKEIPRDANMVLVLGPISGFFDSEVLQIHDYLKKGGAFFLALAPAFKSEVYKNLTSLALLYGLKLGKDIVIDRTSTVQGSEATIPIVNNYDDAHAITAGFELRTVFPLSSSVSLTTGNDNATILSFTSSFPGSWAETDLKAAAAGRAQFKEGVDLKGPVGLLGVGEKVWDEKSPESRLVLLGSSSFLINAYQNQSGNSTLFLNSISWLAHDEGIISFNRPGSEEFPIILSAQHIQMIFVIAILVVPIIFFGCAIFIYRRRRLL